MSDPLHWIYQTACITLTLPLFLVGSVFEWLGCKRLALVIFMVGVRWGMFLRGVDKDFMLRKLDEMYRDPKDQLEWREWLDQWMPD